MWTATPARCACTLRLRRCGAIPQAPRATHCVRTEAHRTGVKGIAVPAEYLAAAVQLIRD
eukprot:1367723-Pleurochrysis_carterae.AAC.1